MLTDNLKKLTALKAKAAALEKQVAAQRNRKLAALPSELGFTSPAEFLKAFRFGMPPHGGFAIGLERLLMQLLGLPNVRLATLFPRDLTRLAP